MSRFLPHRLPFLPSTANLPTRSIALTRSRLPSSAQSLGSIRLARLATIAQLPETQRVALVREQKGPVEFVGDYPVPKVGYNEVLAKVLYTGVCQSGTYFHTKSISSRYPTSPSKTHFSRILRLSSVAMKDSNAQ